MSLSRAAEMVAEGAEEQMDEMSEDTAFGAVGDLDRGGGGLYRGGFHGG